MGGAASNIYALLAVGLALIYGVSHLINFAHGSIFMIGAYVGWLCVTRLGTSLLLTLPAVAHACALLGMAIERVALRPLRGAPRIAPLLSTIGVGIVLDQVAQLMFTPDPHGIPGGRVLRYVFEDTQSAPRQSVAVARKFVGDQRIVVRFSQVRQARLGGARHGVRPRGRTAVRR